MLSRRILAILFDENEGVDDYSIVLDHEHMIIHDDAIIIVQHGYRGFADALDIGHVCQLHTLSDINRIVFTRRTKHGTSHELGICHL